MKPKADSNTRSVQHLAKFSVLTEYECGRAQMAIEWVARSQKPIVEIGGCPTKNYDLWGLAQDLNRCIDLSGEHVRAFVIPDKMRGFCCYGFYHHPWAIRALLFAWGIQRGPKDSLHSLWTQGLLFGYSADAIQRFIASSSSAQASNSRRPACSGFCRLRKVEIYDSLVRLVRPHNSQSDRCRKRGRMKPKAVVGVSRYLRINT